MNKKKDVQVLPSWPPVHLDIFFNASLQKKHEKKEKKGFKERMKASYINKGVIYYKKGKFYDRNMKKDLFLFRHTLSFFQSFWAERKDILAGCRENHWIIADRVGVFLAYKRHQGYERNDPMCLITRKETAFCHLSAGYQESPIKHQSSLFMLPVLLTRISCFLWLLLWPFCSFPPLLKVRLLMFSVHSWFSAAKFAYSVFQFHTNILL